MSIFDFFRKKEKKEIDFTLIKNIDGNYEDFKKRLSNSSLIILITGKRGSGKTALGFKFLELLSNNRKAHYIGQATLPWFIKKEKDIKLVKNNSVVLIDEAALMYSARESMKKENKVLSEIMAIARHKDLTLIISSQNSAMIDTNILRLVDTIIFKEPSLLQSRFERKSILDLFKKTEIHFKKIPSEERKRYFYVLDDEFEGLLTFSLPSFWSEKLSKSFSKF